MFFSTTRTPRNIEKNEVNKKIKIQFLIGGFLKLKNNRTIPIMSSDHKIIFSMDKLVPQRRNCVNTFSNYIVFSLLEGNPLLINAAKNIKQERADTITQSANSILK